MAQYDQYLRLNNTSGNAVDGTQTIAQAAGAMAIDWSQGNCAVATLSGNVTSLAFSNGKAGVLYALVCVQDATGSRTWTSSGATIKWVNTPYLGGTAGSIPTLTTAASKRDLFVFLYDGTNYVQIYQVLNM